MSFTLDRFWLFFEGWDPHQALSQLARFWSLQDPSVRTALAGVVLLGLSCGVLGSFIVLRRMSLVGDSLGHAVLPGVCLGFLVHKTKDITWLFLGATMSALLGSWLIGLIRRQSRIKQDTAMGLVLSGFFALGTVLLTRLQKVPFGNQSGLNQFLFGQASAIADDDVRLMAWITAIIVGVVILGFKELAITSFDEQFSASIGLPATFIHYLLMTLVAVAIVISVQAVGVVLLSAMLITPAATAQLLTQRLRVMVCLSAGIGMASGAIGASLSYVGQNLPTGPLIVLVLALWFVLAYLFSPQQGVVFRAVRRWHRARQTELENVLKSVYLRSVREGRASDRPPPSGPPVGSGEDAQVCDVSVPQLAAERRETESRVRRSLLRLQGQGLVQLAQDQVQLTPAGRARGAELVRNYQLWETFLTQEIQLPADHVHADAEDLEHILQPDLARQLEAQFPPAADSSREPT